MAQPDNSQLPPYYNTQYGETGSSNPSGGMPPPPAPYKGGEAPPPYTGGYPNPPLPQPVLMQQGMPQVCAPAPGPQYVCAHCGQLFAYCPASGLTRCPHCRRVNTVGNWARTRGIIYLVLGIVFLLAAIGVTIGTLAGGGAYYFVWIGGYIVGIAFIIRGILYFTIYKQAHHHCA